MKLPVARIGLLLLLIIVLPTVFFSAYEVSNLYRNEQMIDSIYTQQLESVLFSINQYSDDVVSGWASDIDDLVEDEPNEHGINEFIKRHISIDFVFLADSLGHVQLFANSVFKDSISKYEPAVLEILTTNEVITQRLSQYIKSGYRKIQPIDINLKNQGLFLFSTKTESPNNKICGLVVNTQRFIRENLGPKIQSVAQNTFFISVFDNQSGEEVYSNELAGDEEKNIEHKKKIWLFPDFDLGIELKGETIDDLVKERTYFNMLVIIILDLILLLAAFFVYRAVKQEVKLAQLKSEFVANVSHEIRTPLAIINMYSETLEMNRIKSEEKKQAYYKVINTETNRLSSIVNKILSFSKIESGKREYKFEATNLNEVVEQIIDNYQHHFENKNYKCVFEKDDNIPVINADREAVTDAIINLIDNAIKYSNDKKTINITTGTEKGNVFVEVKDYGIGIAEKDQKLIYDKFYRVTTGHLAYKSKGSGIGLSIVKHIMDAHGGLISLTSKPGKGSSFRLLFQKS